MATPATYKAVIKHYKSCSRGIRNFYSSFEELVGTYTYEVSIAYCFLKLEQSYNRTLYGGARKMRKVHTEIATSVMDKQHLTRDGFLALYKNVYGKALPEGLGNNIKFAEKIRDRIIHGKTVEDKDARKCLVDILMFSEGLESEVLSIASFSPYADMRGLTGKAPSLDKPTSRWVMKGMGFSVS